MKSNSRRVLAFLALALLAAPLRPGRAQDTAPAQDLDTHLKRPDAVSRVQPPGTPDPSDPTPLPPIAAPPPVPDQQPSPPPALNPPSGSLPASSPAAGQQDLDNMDLVAPAEPGPKQQPPPPPPLNPPAGSLPAPSPAAGELDLDDMDLLTLPEPEPKQTPSYSIEIDLGKQRAYLLKDGHKIAESPIASGRATHPTPTGNFSVIQKDLNHFSNLYGKIVEKDSGRTVKSGADIATPVPKGCKFVPAPMRWFMRFEGAAGMHAGILPGYAASHGCVRMPASKAQLFFQTVQLGTPVHVFGSAPAHEIEEEAPHHLAASARPVPTPPPKKHGWWIF